jgi:hypothetical protein
MQLSWACFPVHLHAGHGSGLCGSVDLCSDSVWTPTWPAVSLHHRELWLCVSECMVPLFIIWATMGLGAEVGFGVRSCGSVCFPDSSSVSCDCLCPRRGGGDVHFRFPWWIQWNGGCSLSGIGSILVCQDPAARPRWCRVRSETSSGALVGLIPAPLSFLVFHVEVCYDGRKRWAHGHTIDLSLKLCIENEARIGQNMVKESQDTFLEMTS